MSPILQIPLDIPNVTLDHMETTTQGHRIITVRSTVLGTDCHQCGQEITKMYGNDRGIVLRHLPILGRKTFIRLHPVRYQCQSCRWNPTTTQRLCWYTSRCSCTKAFENHILLQLINSTVKDICIKEDIGYEVVMGIIDRYINHTIDWTVFTHLDVIGIDEIALKKGHKDFVTIVTARIKDETIILGVVKGRKKEIVKAFLRTIPRYLRQSVHSVCCDMYDGFINAAKEVFGKRMKIIIDRFHVAKLYRKGLDNLRQKELRRLKESLSEEAYKQLQGAMWALRKSGTDLKDKDNEVLAQLFTYSSQLEMAYDFCQELTGIFNRDITKRQGKKQLKDWMKRVTESELTCFNRFMKTLSNWLDEVANYFLSRLTSGFVEGLNNKIKVIKRRCYGILNPAHLFQRIHLDLSGYAIFAYD
jgi:transposase